MCLFQIPGSVCELPASQMQHAEIGPCGRFLRYQFARLKKRGFGVIEYPDVERGQADVEGGDRVSIRGRAWPRKGAVAANDQVPGDGDQQEGDEGEWQAGARAA